MTSPTPGKRGTVTRPIEKEGTVPDFTDSERDLAERMENLIETVREAGATDRMLAEWFTGILVVCLGRAGWKLFDPENPESLTEWSVSLDPASFPMTEA